MSTVDDMTAAVGAGLVPDDPAALHATMEGLPEFYETLAGKLDELAVFAGGSIGGQTSAKLTELAKAASAASATAGEAFIEYENESSGWR